jgi:hypothetical protein
LNLCAVVGRAWVDSLFHPRANNSELHRASRSNALRSAAARALMIPSASFMFDTPDFMGIVSGGEGIKYTKRECG